MKSKSYDSLRDLAISLGVDPQLGDIAVLKASLTMEIQKTVIKKKITHQEISEISGIPRSAITGIISGSLQRVTIDRLMRVLISLGKTVSIKIKDVA